MKVQHAASQTEPSHSTSHTDKEVSDGFTETVSEQKEFEKFQIINWLFCTKKRNGRCKQA